MTANTTLEALLDPSPTDFSVSDSALSLMCLAIALLAWVVAEALMAPVLRPALAALWIGYALCFYLFVGWYFRMSRLFETPWRSYAAALNPMIWAATPLHLMLPTALLMMHAGTMGIVLYEIMKAGVILAVLGRMVGVVQQLNRWPRWAALVLILSPLAIAGVGLCLMIGLGAFGALALVAGAFQS